MTDMNKGNKERVHLEGLGGGRFAVRSDLTFECATIILSQSKRLFADCEHISVDMSGVQQADSAGLALLLEWISWAQHFDRKIAYENIPKQILAIAKISEVTGILSAAVEIPVQPNDSDDTVSANPH